MFSTIPQSVLITGANRGIGFEFLKQFLRLPSPPKHIFAACRNPEKLLALAAENKSITIIKYDAYGHSTFDEIKSVVQAELGETEGLNLLINSAGIATREDFTLRETTAATMLDMFTVNAVAPTMLTRALLPLLLRGATPDGKMAWDRAIVINLTSRISSIGGIADSGCEGKFYSYRTSKVALNMLTSNLAAEFGAQGVMCLSLDPGWVKTDMGGPGAITAVDEAVTMMMNVMATAGKEQSGKCIGPNGINPW